MIATWGGAKPLALAVVRSIWFLVLTRIGRRRGHSLCPLLYATGRRFGRGAATRPVLAKFVRLCSDHVWDFANGNKGGLGQGRASQNYVSLGLPGVR